MHFNGFAPISGEISSQICIKKVLQSCLQHTKRWSVACPLRMHFLHSQLEFFPENLGAVSDEQGEIFHEDIQAMEERYKGVWNEGMRMGDYCWMLYHDDTNHPHKQKSLSYIFKFSSFELVLIAVLSGTQIESKHFPQVLFENILLKLS